jgi:hypothetical protein
MKWFFWTLIFLVFVTPIIFIGKGIDHLDIMKDRYKRALDAGASSAARAYIYDDRDSLEYAAIGFGSEMQHGDNILVDKDNALNWFYKVFFRNLGIEDDMATQENIKKYIPMKAIASFDRLMIANLHDQWIYEREYLIDYKGTKYYFTMSDQVREKNTNLWGRDIDFGISPIEREALVSEFIRKELNKFLEGRENYESNNTYSVNIAGYNSDEETENIGGISFIVMLEGMPLPTLNPWKVEKFYAFALGGTEISRN